MKPIHLWSVVICSFVVFGCWRSKNNDAQTKGGAADQAAAGPVCPEQKTSVSYANDFKWTREISCSSIKASESDCCEEAIKDLAFKAMNEKPGMKDCKGRVAPKYLERLVSCAVNQEEKPHCSISQKDGENIATVSNFFGICKCQECTADAADGKAEKKQEKTGK